MNSNYLRLCALILACGTFVQAQVPITPVMNIPNTGQQITPEAPRGARFTYLNPGLVNYPGHVVGQGVTGVVSPDGKTLLVLTSGDYGIYTSTGSQDTAASTDWVFVFNITSPVPVQLHAYLDTRVAVSSRSTQADAAKAFITYMLGSNYDPLWKSKGLDRHPPE